MVGTIGSTAPIILALLPPATLLFLKKEYKLFMRNAYAVNSRKTPQGRGRGAERSLLFEIVGYWRPEYLQNLLKLKNQTETI